MRARWPVLLGSALVLAAVLGMQARQPVADAASTAECGSLRQGTAPAGDTLRPGEHGPAWSPDGRSIAFAFETDEPRAGHGVYVGDVTTGATRRVVGGGPDGAMFPSWSPSGRRVAFHHGSFDVATIGVDGRGRRELRLSGGWPVWSPDGCWIAVSDLSGLYVVRPDGTGRRRLGDGEDPAWSADGKRLAFSDGDIWVAEVSTWRARRLIVPPGVAILPSWSPDAKSIVYAMADPREDGNFFGTWSGGTMFVVDVASRRARRLTGGNQPVWSPTGDRIAFTRTNGCDAASIWTIRPDGSGARRLTKGPVDHSPTWSPDGGRIAFSRAAIARGCSERPARIVVIGADGTGASRLTRPASIRPAPNVLGDTVVRAVKRLTAAGYRPIGRSGASANRYRLAGPFGARAASAWRICRQDASTDPAGTTTVDLLAAAACTVPVPDLRDTTLRAAERVLARLGYWAEPESLEPDMTKGDILRSWLVCRQGKRPGARIAVVRSGFFWVGVAPRCP